MLLLLWHPKATGVAPPTPPSVATATPGRVLFTGLTGRRHDEDEKPKFVPLPDVPRETETIDRTAEYVRQSARLAKALKRLHVERDALLANISRLEAIRTAKAEHELLLQRQALQLAAAQEALVIEQLEVIDVAYCAATILTLQ
jgi:hypothetical protein